MKYICLENILENGVRMNRGDEYKGSLAQESVNRLLVAPADSREARLVLLELKKLPEDVSAEKKETHAGVEGRAKKKAKAKE